MKESYRERLKRRLVTNDAGKLDFLNFNARCVRKFGPTAGTFIRQLVYWVGKEHDQEGWIYKTQREMEEETGLSRHHQEKARNILLSQGVLMEDRRGLPRRLWYWVDLEALLNVMETPHSTLNQWARKQENNAAETTNEWESASRGSITEHTDEIDSMARASRNGSTVPASEDDSSAPASEEDTTDRPITESTAQTTAESSSDNYWAENSNFQFGEDHASRGLSPKKSLNMTDTQKRSIGGLELNHIYYLLTTPGSNAYRQYELHKEGSLSLTDLASEVCLSRTGGRERAELYIEPVQRMVTELAIEDATGDRP